ncbi:hypothetical protein EKO04_005197 [Ascochyta lentis]|uniref:Uncharacterized protein n=1 Tax=Ascochyta lentis TaxID=205686 RepID=A0A8H7J4A0_9PLEO|nr:hypothetical protein EKO04_005197 [Ascochyta lentis]
MEFEDHAFREPGIGLQFVRLRLLIGYCRDNNPFKRERKVWAYLKPYLNQSDRVAPIVEMILEEQSARGSRNEVQITWATDIQSGQVNLQPLFTEIVNDAQLKALIKYCFLLASKARLFGYERHHIPVNSAFVTQLTKICEQLDAANTEAETSDDKESTSWPSNTHQMQPLVSKHKQTLTQCALHTDTQLNAARQMDQSNVRSEPPPLQAIDSKNCNCRQTDPAQQGTAQRYVTPTRMTIGQVESKEVGQDRASHLCLGEESVLKVPQMSLHVLPRDRHGSSSGSDGYSSDEPSSGPLAMAKPIHHTQSRKQKAVSRKISSNPLGNRRPPKGDNRDFNIDLLKKQHTTISGRISGKRTAIADHLARLTKHEAAIAKLETEERVLLGKKVDIEKKLENAQHENGAM